MATTRQPGLSSAAASVREGKNGGMAPGSRVTGANWRNRYFLALQPHRLQGAAAASSCLFMHPLSPQLPHFFGLQRPSLVAPHFSHLNTAIFCLLC